MKAREIYKRFLLKINKNDTNEGVNILPSAFVLLFNTESVRWLGEKLKFDADNVKLENLSELYESDVELKFLEKKTDYIEFEVPANFYRHASSFAIVSKGACKDVQFFYFEKKPLGFNAILADYLSKAHFDFEEGPFIITKNRLKAYTDEFDIEKFLFSYYKVPDKIDMAGYTNFDGQPSQDIDCNLIDDNIDEVLNRMAAEINREVENAEGLQYSKDRIQTEP